VKHLGEDGLPTNKDEGPKINEFLLVVDTMGWKEFKKAKTPNMDKLGKAEVAVSPSFYTTPSVYCMMHGLIPQPLNRTFWPYGRYCRAENSNIPETYEKHGYNTYLLSANPVLRNEVFETDQEVLAYTPYFMYSNDKCYDSLSSERLFNWFLKNKKSPFWCLCNVIEAHTPFLGVDKKSSTQIKAIEYVDKKIGMIVEGLHDPKYKTRIIIVGDHSEAWIGAGKSSEKNLGHNPRWLSNYFRKKKMERLTKVPLIVGYV